MGKKYLWLAVLLALAGLALMLWPLIHGSRLESQSTQAAQTFLAERENEPQYPELLAELKSYNRRIFAENQSGLVDLEACEAPAADLTAYGIEDEIIGVLTIPTIGLTMPIYLGASNEHLALGAAVLGQTSIPIGGTDTNCVTLA